MFFMVEETVFLGFLNPANEERKILRNLLFTSTYRSTRFHIPEYLNFRQQSYANLGSVSHVCMQLIPLYLNACRIFFLQSTVIWPSLSTYKIKPFHFLPYGLQSTTNIQDILSDHH